MFTYNIGMAADATNTVDVFTATFSPEITLNDRRMIFVQVDNHNETSSPTFNPDSLGAKPIYRHGMIELFPRDLSGDCLLMYHTDNGGWWELITPKISRYLIAGADDAYAYDRVIEGGIWEASAGDNNGSGSFQIQPAFSKVAHDVETQIVSPSFVWNGETVAKITSSITNADTTHSPSGDAVFDALELKENSANKVSSISASSTQYPNNNAVIAYAVPLTTPKLIANPIMGALTNSSPGDAVTVYFGKLMNVAPNATSTTRLFKLKTGVIRSGNINIAVNTTLGSAGNITFNIRNITDGISTLLGVLSATASMQNVLLTSLNISTDLSKDYAIEVITPTWTTNPINIQYELELNIFDQ